MDNLNLDAVSTLKRSEAEKSAPFTMPPPPAPPPPASEESFGALRFIVTVNKVVAWGILAVSLIAALASTKPPPGAIDQEPTFGLITIGILAGGALGWVTFMAAAQSMRVFMAMEEHLRHLRNSAARR